MECGSGVTRSTRASRKRGREAGRKESVEYIGDPCGGFLRDLEEGGKSPFSDLVAVPAALAHVARGRPLLLGIEEQLLHAAQVEEGAVLRRAVGHVQGGATGLEQGRRARGAGEQAQQPTLHLPLDPVQHRLLGA